MSGLEDAREHVDAALGYVGALRDLDPLLISAARVRGYATRAAAELSDVLEALRAVTEAERARASSEQVAARAAMVARGRACRACGGPLPDASAAGGRPRRWCSSACRQRGWRNQITDVARCDETVTKPLPYNEKLGA